MPQLANRGNIIDQPLYDTMQLAAAAGNVVDFFTVPLGGLLVAGVPKTRAHTNMTQAGQLAQGVGFVCKGLAVKVRQLDAEAETAPTFADYAVLQDGWLELILDDRNFGYYPLSDIPGGSGLVFFSDAAAAAVNNTTRGVAHQQNIRWLEYPIEFVQQQNFRVRLHVPGTIGATTDVMCFLYGPYTRPVS